MQKSIFSTLFTFTLLSLNASAGTPVNGILTYNKQNAIYDSKEHKALTVSFEKKQQDFEKECMSRAQKLQEESEKLKKMVSSSIVTPSALEERKSKFTKELRDYERFREIESQEMNIAYKEEEAKLGKKVTEYATEIFKEKHATALFDSSRPEIEAVDMQTDITNEVLKLADARYETSNKKSSGSEKKDSKSA